MSDPLNWTKVTRVTIDHQGDLGDEIDQIDQGDEDYQGVLGCTVRCCAVLGGTAFKHTCLDEGSL